jgi:hypothetical protein
LRGIIKSIQFKKGFKIATVCVCNGNIQTTTRCARVSAALVSKAKSPLDRLPKTG